MIFRKKNIINRLWKRNVRQENEKYWKYQVNNKFEKIFIKVLQEDEERQSKRRKLKVQEVQCETGRLTERIKCRGGRRRSHPR